MVGTQLKAGNWERLPRGRSSLPGDACFLCRYIAGDKANNLGVAYVHKKHGAPIDTCTEMRQQMRISRVVGCKSTYQFTCTGACITKTATSTEACESRGRRERFIGCMVHRIHKFCISLHFCEAG
ncbi:uncharacterized protein LOC122527814 [Frieseomelitta varia]|uniref:uncharacterized protein LOC122527814 n=1 Tax=Frieseomelitta varia TaxID=561572 RepID=UPI001CB68BF3|nr:uncharacterized protein LOC122527814 [Frieseomelitta varia]